MAKATKTTTEVYTDKDGNKVVEPVYSGVGGCACGVIGMTKQK